MSEVLDFSGANSSPLTLRRSCRSAMPVHVRDLRLKLEGEELLKGVNLSLVDDGITVLLGPNGAGKTLLLKCLHGLIKPTSGTIGWTVEGEERYPSPAVRKQQAMVLQKPVLLRRSVLANLRFAANLRPPKASRQALMEALKAARLDQLARHSARNLSGGEQQRLALARALLLKPKVLFLDEPAANLDPASTLMIEDTIRRAQQEHTKIVLVTHDLAQARRLADDVVFLHKGRILEHSPARRFFQQPATAEGEAYVQGEILL